MPYAWRVAIPLVGRPDDATKVDCGGQGKHGDPGPDGVHVSAENHAEDNCNDQKHDGLARQISGWIAPRIGCWIHVHPSKLTAIF